MIIWSHVFHCNISHEVRIVTITYDLTYFITLDHKIDVTFMIH